MTELDRRTWLRLAGALSTLHAVEAELEAQEPAKPRRQALQLIGLEFKPENEAMMLSGVNRNLAG